MTERVRVAFLGAGRFSTSTHMPNVSKLPDAEIIAICDLDSERLSAAGKKFGVAALYGDYHEMLDREKIDVLFSIVRAFQRTDADIIAAQKGIHLFIEKPQTNRIEKAKEIDRAIRESGVMSTVGYRERFRPMVHAAREFMADKKFLHAHMFSFRELPQSPYTLEQMGGGFLDWGGHYVDQVRYITGHNVALAQAFFVDDPDKAKETDLPLAQCASFCFDNGATAGWDVLSCLPAGGPRVQPSPRFFFAYKGGLLEITSDELKDNGEIIYETEPICPGAAPEAPYTDPAGPWFLSAKAFIEAVRTGDRSLIRNDFSDGLLSLAPILAARESAQKGGQVVNLREFVGS